MLAERRVHVTLPVADLDRARAFWEGLGFTPHSVQPTAVLYPGPPHRDHPAR